MNEPLSNIWHSEALEVQLLSVMRVCFNALVAT